MAESSETGDYFGTFLDALESQEQGSAQPSDGLVRILTLLASKSPRPVFELAYESGVGLADFSAELTTARTAGFVDVAGAPPDEQVALTAAGEELASRLAQA